MSGSTLKRQTMRVALAAAMAMLVALPLQAATSRSPVADAAERGDTAAVKKLIAGHADVNAPQSDGTTALHWAAYHADAALAKELITAGANVKATTREGSTPLWLACINGDAKTVGELLSAGVDANEALPFGRTPLMVAARAGNLDTITLLLDHGAKVNAKEQRSGTTPLMWAADQGNSAVVKLLIDHGADINIHSDPATRGRGPALGKADDPRKAVAAQVAAIKNGKVRDIFNLAATDDGTTPRRFRGPVKDGGGLTALSYATRANDLESVKVLLGAGADVNQVTNYGWSPLLIATQNRYYKLGAYLLDHGADPNLANEGGWTPLYLATDNRNIESGDYPVRQADMDHLDYIKLLLAKGADVNARVKDSTETRTVFTNQWLDEKGATAFLRASQSGDVELMKLLLAHGADPHINTDLGVTPLQVAAGIGWVEGITYEWSPKSTYEAVKMLLELGVDVNAQAQTGRTAMHGAAHKGRTDVIQILFDHGARLDIRDYGNTDNRGDPKLAGHTWLPVDYADGLVRVGVQSALAHPEAGKLIRKLMTEQGLNAPPMGRTLESVCMSDSCD
jgi:ankyrin repeat protein